MLNANVSAKPGDGKDTPLGSTPNIDAQNPIGGPGQPQSSRP